MATGGAIFHTELQPPGTNLTCITRKWNCQRVIMYSQIQKHEVYMVCEKEAIGFSGNFKVQYASRGKIFVDTLLTLA